MASFKGFCRYLTCCVLYSSGTIRMLETSYFAASTDYQSKRSEGKDNSILACPGKGRSSEMSKTSTFKEVYEYMKPFYNSVIKASPRPYL